MRKDANKRPTNVRNARRVTPGQRLGGAWSGLRSWYAGRTEPREDVEEDEDEAPRTPWLRILGVSAALVCVALVGFVVANLSDYTDRTQQFHVAHFQVAGNKRMTKDQLIAVCGVQPGSSLMKLDPHQVERHLETLPWVRHATVQQMLPSTLAIQVVEYQPFALLLGQQLAIVDRSGYVFKLAEPGEADDLPIITGFSTDLIRAGETVGATEAAQLTLAGTATGRETPTQRKLRDLLNLIEAHAMSPLAQRFPLSEVHFDQVLGTTLISAKDGAEVRLGHAMESDLGRAFTMVGRVLDRVETRGEWLKYALLDDELRPDRAVVQAVALGGDVPVDAPKAGGAAGAPTPNAKGSAKKLVAPADDAPNDD
jgi:hypothetical protein